MDDLARDLEKSDIKEIADLAKAYLELKKENVDLLTKLVNCASREIMNKHYNTLKRLAD